MPGGRTMHRESPPTHGRRELRIVPVTPSGEQLNGSILRSEGAYSIVDRGNGFVKNTGSTESISTTSR